MLDWARTRDVEVVLVEMPMAEDVEREHPREFAEFRALLREISATYGVQLVSVSRRQLGLTDAQFFDLGHLNAEGVRRFTGWLRQQLDETP
jgi:hypothetical protein